MAEFVTVRKANGIVVQMAPKAARSLGLAPMSDDEVAAEYADYRPRVVAPDLADLDPRFRGEQGPELVELPPGVVIPPPDAPPTVSTDFPAAELNDPDATASGTTTQEGLT